MSWEDIQDKAKELGYELSYEESCYVERHLEAYDLVEAIKILIGRYKD